MGSRPQRHADLGHAGDARRDVEAGRAAGTRTLVALFGYLGREDEPHEWGADGLIEHPLDLLRWIHP